MEIVDKESAKKLVSMILDLNHSFRCVGFIDNYDNTMFSKMNEGKTNLITNTEEEKFVMDLQ